MPLAFVVRRALHALTVLLVVCTATFAIIHLAPGGPALLADPKLTPAEQRAIEQRLGIDRPLVEQYGRWLGRAVRGDFGDSFLYQTPTLRTIVERLPSTALLAGAALALSLLVALPLGARCAAHPGGWTDRIAGAVSFGAMAIPAFWFGIVLILVFAVGWRVLPAGGLATVGVAPTLGDRLRHLVMPALVLAAAGTAELLRYTRSSVRSALHEPHVRTARGKGLTERAVRRHHAFRNALLPIVTVIGLQLPRLIGGAAVTETVFSWPGMGRLGIEAALSRDYPLVMAITVIVALTVVVLNLAVDLLYLWVDPRIRLR